MIWPTSVTRRFYFWGKGLDMRDNTKTLEYYEYDKRYFAIS